MFVTLVYSDVVTNNNNFFMVIMMMTVRTCACNVLNALAVCKIFEMFLKISHSV